MQIYNPQGKQTLGKELSEQLAAFRNQRGFEPEAYLEAKAQRLNDYMADCSLNACVVAVSGGLDSSVVLAIVDYAARQPRSPIEKILALSLPVFDKGATGQDEASARASELCRQLNIEFKVVDLSSPFNALAQQCEQDLGLSGDDWSRGQLVSYLRTPAIYYSTSLLTANGYKSIVVGTNNRDEGAYIGYFGKASDGMVDIQLISDAHKGDLRRLADYLDLPQSIRQVAPSGDMYDGRLDEEVFGAPYDFVELYTHYLGLDEAGRAVFQQRLSASALKEFRLLCGNLDNMHRYNGHKYLGASPAVHLDILPSRIEAGWHYRVYEGKEMACEQPFEGDHRRW